MSDLAQRRSAFRKLHESGCFVIPNPWDIGSAKYLALQGFKALATTSAGFGFSKGLPDNVLSLPRELVLTHIAEIAHATDLPVNADFQSGYADTPEGVAESVRLCIATGVSGLSIEDATGDSNKPLYELPEALDRLKAAREAIDASGHDVLLTARAECFLVGHSDPLNESLKRLAAYAEAGADVLFAPGLRNADEVTAVVKAVHPKPVNMIVFQNIGLTVNDLAELGVRRISVGSALARAAWSGFISALEPLTKKGSFEGFGSLVPFATLNDAFEEK
jgi:2-methylisocitrate lyase-like PEP mutase family enzyme